MCTWLPFLDWTKEYDLLDVFAGRGRIGRLAHRAGFKSAVYDIEYNKPRWARSKHSRVKRRSFMDINGESGFLLPGWICII